MTFLARTALFVVVVLTTLPAGAQGMELNLPCDNFDGLPVVTVDDGVTVDVDTPIGTGVPFVTTVKVQTVDGGDYLVDLAGEEVGVRKNVDVSLSWTNGVNDDLTDYDMIVDGTVYQDISNPEQATIFARHCQVISVDEIYTWVGTPADSLTLDLRMIQPPANDDFADAESQPRSWTVDDSNEGATFEPGEPHHADVQSASASIWYR